MPMHLGRILPVAVAVVLVGGGLAVWATSSRQPTPTADVGRSISAPTADPMLTMPPTTMPTVATTTTQAPPTTTTKHGITVVTRAMTVPAAPAGSRTFTFVNDVDQTIWLAGWQQTPTPALTTSGWVLPARQSVTVVVPDHWNGRFWGRTGCSFDGSGHGHCVTGDCGGVFQCKGYGSIPATLAEYNLNSFDGLDFYDVSMVDGSNLPMYINIAKGGTADKISPTGCVAAGCTTAVQCPAALVVDGGAGCESACGKLGGDQYCCTGQFASRSACNPAQWPIDYAAVFKKAEPYAYSYADDDATSTFTCTGECDYRITFGLTP